MNQTILKHKEGCKFLTFTDALGKAIVYKDILESFGGNEIVLLDFIHNLQVIVDEEMIVARPIFTSINYFKRIDGVLMDTVNILHKEVFLNQFKTLVLNRKCDIRKAFLLAYTSNKELVLKNTYTNVSKDEIEDILEYTKKRIYSLMSKMLIKNLTKDINEDFIFITENFQSEIFDDVSKYLKGVICLNQPIEGEPSAYSIDFGFPLIVCNYPIASNQYILIDQAKKVIIINPTDELKNSHSSLINSRSDDKFEDLNFKNPQFKIFASTVDTLSIDTIAQSNNYHGLCTFKTEYYFNARGITPSLEEQTAKYVDVIQRMGDKEVFLEIPHFDHNIKLEIMKDEVTDIRGVDRFGKIFEVFFDAIANASFITQKRLNIVIPMIMSKKEVDDWLMHIEYHFDQKNALRPNIGGALESELAIMYGTDFEKLDFIIIGLDDIYDEIDEDYDKLKGNAHIDMIDPISLDDLRRLHKLMQRLKSFQRHILHGNVLTNPEVLHKFLKRGFKEFAIPVNKMHLVYDVFKKHLDSVGNYIGYRAMIKAKKLAQSLKNNQDDDNEDQE
jgi:signal transduction protein with GAF and PtsI domain